MTTKKRFCDKFRLLLRERDHEPLHVHLVGGEVNARIDSGVETMAQMKCARLQAVEVLSERRLQPTFINGQICTVDFKTFLNENAQRERWPAPTSAPGEGWTVEWPELDIR